MRLWRALLLLVSALASMAGAVLIGAPPASALALIDGTSPAPDSTINEPPLQLILVFDEDLETPPAVILQDSNRTPVLTAPPARGDDGQIWIASVSGSMAPGVYRVVWNAGATNSEYTFTLGEAATTTPAPVPVETATATNPQTGDTPPSTAGTTTPTPAPPGETSGPKLLGAVGRLLSFIGIGAVGGALLLFVIAWPEGVEYLLTLKYLRTMWIIGLLGTVMHVVAQRALMDDSSIGSAVVPSAWFDLAQENGGGLALVMRLVLFAASGWVVLRPDRVVDTASQIPALAFPFLTLLTFGFSRAGSAELGAVGTAAGVVHALGFAAWFGGVALLARVVLTGPGEADLLNAVRGFGRIAGPALIALVVSGGLHIIPVLGGPENLVSTGYGRLLLVKCFVVIIAITFSTQNRAVVRARLAKAPYLTAKAAGRLRRAVSSELLAGLLVIAVSGWMMAGTPPKVASGPKVVGPQPVVSVALQDDGGVDVSVGANPATVGLNAITIVVKEPPAGLVEMVVRLTHDAGLADGIEIDVTPKLGGKGTLQIIDVPLNAAGSWTVTVRGSDTDGELPTVTGTLAIGEVDAVEGTPPAVSSSVVTPPLDGAAVTPNNTTTVPPGD